MQTGDNNQQGPQTTSDETTESIWPLQNSMESNLDEVHNYVDVVKVLSEVELPSPSPVQLQATSCTLTREDYFNRFHDQGQSSGTKRKADEIEENVERESELKSTQQRHDCRQPRSRREASKTKITDKRRRNRISEKIRTLRTLVPNCNKKHKASILGDAIEYIKSLQMQVQMMQSMGIGHMPQGLDYMTLSSQLRLPTVQNLAPNFTMTPLIGMQHGMPQFGSYFPINYPIFPTSFLPGFRPMQVGARPILYPEELQFPSQISQSVYSTTLSSGTVIPTTTYSQAGSATGHGQRPLYYAPMTSQGTE